MTPYPEELGFKSLSLSISNKQKLLGYLQNLKNTNTKILTKTTSLTEYSLDYQNIQ